MSALSFRDFRDRLSMEEVLKAAGYRFNRRDGMRYPSYVAVDTQGQRIKGDKFIVMPDRKRCFQPPFQQTYNVVSFIRAFPEKFSEYQMGMNVDRLVNLVCNRLLNSPVQMNQGGFKTIYDNKPFDLSRFKITTFDLDNWDKIRQFYPYFRARGIDMSTMRAFSRSIILTSKVTSSGKEHVNLSFPLRKPSTQEGTRVLGLELRSRPDREGKTRFKGLAQGSEATTGLWMANPDTEQWKRDLQDRGRGSIKDRFSFNSMYDNAPRSSMMRNGVANGFENQSPTNLSNSNQENPNNTKDKEGYNLPPLPQKGDIYWFESGYDAMAYYQLHRKTVDFKDAIFVSTSGNPSMRQFQAVMEQFPENHHHLCFDNDMAGRMFTLNFLLQLKGDGYCTRMDKGKDLLVVYNAWTCEPLWHIPSSDFNMEQISQILDIDPEAFTREVPTSGYKDWNDELLGKIGKMESPRLQMLQPIPQNLLPKQDKVEAIENIPQVEKSREVVTPHLQEQNVHPETNIYRFKR